MMTTQSIMSDKGRAIHDIPRDLYIRRTKRIAYRNARSGSIHGRKTYSGTHVELVTWETGNTSPELSIMSKIEQYESKHLH